MLVVLYFYCLPWLKYVLKLIGKTGANFNRVYNKKYSQRMNLIKICILHLTAFILTIFLTLHHFITYLLLLSLHCLPLTLTKELSRLNRWGEESEKKVHGMQIIINSCVSMVSALVVVGYAEKFVSVAQWVSVEVHQYFLG